MFVLPPALTPFLYAAIILGLTWLVARVGAFLVGELMQQSSPQVALGARRLVAVVIWLMGGILAIQEIGLSVEVLLLVVALCGIAALIALREQLENLGAKYFSDVYSPFKLGDQIRIREHEGRVIEINAMTTVLLTADDRLVSLPNSMFMREPMVNESPQAWKELTVPFSVPGSVDLAEFESELRKRLGKLRMRLDRRFPPVVTTRSRSPQVAELAVTVMIRRAEDRESLLTEVHRRIAEALQTAPSPPRSAPATSPLEAPRVPPAPSSEGPPV